MLKNFITNWILAPKLWIYCQITVKKILTFRNKTSPEIKKFKNIHSGKRCFILATGPSINQMELSVLKDEVTIAVSFFGYHKNLNEISPKYHVFAPNHEPLGEKNALNFCR